MEKYLIVKILENSLYTDELFIVKKEDIKKGWIYWDYKPEERVKKGSHSPIYNSGTYTGYLVHEDSEVYDVLESELPDGENINDENNIFIVGDGDNIITNNDGYNLHTFVLEVVDEIEVKERKVIERETEFVKISYITLDDNEYVSWLSRYSGSNFMELVISQPHS